MSRLSSNVDAVGCPGRLSAIRMAYAPGSTARAFGRLVGDPRWRSWEGEGHVPSEARLAAALSGLPGANGLALAKWGREGGGDMPIGKKTEGRSEAVMRNVLRLWAVVETLPEEAAAALRPILKDLSGSLSSTSKHKVLRPTG